MLDLAPYAPPLATRPASRSADVAGVATTTACCRLVVADDHPLYREGIVRALEFHGGFDVVGQAGDGAQALAMIRALEPDMALLDVRMPLLDGVDVVHALALHGPDVPVIMLSAFSEQQLVDSALEAGAAAYVNKGEDREQLCERLAAIGEHLGALAPRQLSPHDPVGHQGRWLPRLTGLEHQLLQLAGHGLDKQELADALNLSESDVRTRAAAVARKFDCDALPGAVARARSLGLVR